MSQPENMHGQLQWYLDGYVESDLNKELEGLASGTAGDVTGHQPKGRTMARQIYDPDQIEPEHRVVVLDDIQDIHAGDPLDGVPFELWWMGFLKKVLEHDGVAVPYPNLAGFSGEAFSIHYE